MKCTRFNTENNIGRSFYRCVVLSLVVTTAIGLEIEVISADIAVDTEHLPRFTLPKLSSFFTEVSTKLFSTVFIPLLGDFLWSPASLQVGMLRKRGANIPQILSDEAVQGFFLDHLVIIRARMAEELAARARKQVGQGVAATLKYFFPS